MMVPGKLGFLNVVKPQKEFLEPEWVLNSRKLVQQVASWISGPEFESVLQVQETSIQVRANSEDSLHSFPSLVVLMPGAMREPRIHIHPVGRIIAEACPDGKLLGQVDVRCGAKRFLLLADTRGHFWILGIDPKGGVPLTEDSFFGAPAFHSLRLRSKSSRVLNPRGSQAAHGGQNAQR